MKQIFTLDPHCSKFSLPILYLIIICYSCRDKDGTQCVTTKENP